MRLENKVAIVTGAVGGIGGEIVKHFVAEGARVLAVDLDQSKVDSLADSYGAQVLGAVADVTDYAQVAATIDKAVEHFGTLDVMVNNAGIGMPKMLLDHYPVADFEIVTAVNQKGVYLSLIHISEPTRR